MRRLLALSLVTSLIGLSSGCAMCCAPYDCNYISTAGRWVRNNPTSGRVGSAFDEAGGPIDVVPVSATEPTPAQPGTNVQTAPPRSTPAAPMYRTGPGMPSQQPSRMAPGTRSVIPRNMGQTYLPQGE